MDQQGQDPVEIRVEVNPPWPFRLRGGSPDGLFRRRGSAVQRLLHVGDEPVLVGAVQASRDRVIFGARSACADAAVEGIARMRFATGVDDDLREFHEEFRRDPIIGHAVRERPWLRVRRRPDPWEALSFAVTEQLIEFDRAVIIQRRMVAALGRRWAGFRDAPTAAAVAAEAPARLCSFDLAEARVLALRRAAREVAAGRIDLRRHEPAWRQLRAIPGIGPWTVEMLAVFGQGRHDQVPAGDVGYLKLVGRLTTGNPRARADIAEVRGFFERYGPWKALAAEYLRLSTPFAASAVPRPAGTRW
jgi:3-methyladenine DNA glycosylase/8-oxoguanine DNA glycosylase